MLALSVTIGRMITAVSDRQEVLDFIIISQVRLISLIVFIEAAVLVLPYMPSYV
jgi:hypothetical protein